MNASNRNFRARSGVSSQRRFTEMPEDVGNRHGFLESRIPSDDVGNMIDNDPIATFVHDSLGNSLDGEPAHLKSGFFSNTGARESRPRKAYRPEPKQLEIPIRENRAKPISTTKQPSAEEFMETLKEEFAKLLKNRLGMPFSFSMRPNSGKVREDEEKDHLDSIELLIKEMFESLSIKATLEMLKYRTDLHHFAVFFIHSEEKDPVKNKDLISALRQVVSLFEKSLPPVDINVMLVLSNARSIIEDHLQKIGAKKIG